MTVATWYAHPHQNQTFLLLSICFHCRFLESSTDIAWVAKAKLSLMGKKVAIWVGFLWRSVINPCHISGMLLSVPLPSLASLGWRHHAIQRGFCQLQPLALGGTVVTLSISYLPAISVCNLKEGQASFPGPWLYSKKEHSSSFARIPLESGFFFSLHCRSGFYVLDGSFFVGCILKASCINLQLIYNCFQDKWQNTQQLEACWLLYRSEGQGSAQLSGQSGSHCSFRVAVGTAGFTCLCS